MIELAAILLNLNLATVSHLDSTYSTKNSSPVLIAHEVKISNDVGGTIHIEPNDRPIAGRKSRVWIGLTKRGGDLIPYDRCDCLLEVRSLTDKSIQFTASKLPSILDRYLGLPSIEVIFPQVGRYELRLTGSAKEGTDFADFVLVFTINVGK
jgi:hypothetical protein